MNVGIKNIIITVVIKPRLTWQVDPGPRLVQEKKKIEEWLTWPDLVENPG